MVRVVRGVRVIRVVRWSEGQVVRRSGGPGGQVIRAVKVFMMADHAIVEAKPHPSCNAGTSTLTTSWLVLAVFNAAFIFPR